jgi:hypothetical protein
MRAIFKSFDNFMAIFVAMFGVAWSTVFMPLLGGPLHTYEARAIGAGWESLQTGEAGSISEAFEIATSFPAEAVFPSAHAAELPAELTAIEVKPEPLELLGGPEDDGAPTFTGAVRRAAPRVSSPRVMTVSMTPVMEAVPDPICDIPAMKQGVCERDARFASEGLATGA